MKRYELALTELKTAVQMKPDYARAWRYIGSAYLNMKKYEDAADAYRTAVKYKKDFTEAWIWLGASLESLNRYTEAIDAYKRAAAIESNNSAAWFGIGSGRYMMGDHAGAIAAINRWKELTHGAGEPSKKRMADLYLGHSYLGIGQFDPAVAAFMRVIAEDPNNARAILGLGQVYIAMNKPAMVAQQKAKLEKLDPVFAAKLQQRMAEAGVK